MTAPTVADMVLGRLRLITGVVDQPDGSLRVYVHARSSRVFFRVTDGEDSAALREAWATKLPVYVSVEDVPAAALDVES